MSLEDKIYQDYIGALKAKDKAKADFLSYLRAEIKNAAISEKKDSLADSQVQTVLKKQKKRLQESLDSMANTSNQAALDEIRKQSALVDDYLPKQLTAQELNSLIETVIKEQNATSLKDMSKVMREITLKAGAQLDPKLASQIVKEKLS